ncbi:MAG: MXAN_6640 family putative metalloprotease [Aggregatilineales bacterium]
MPRPFLRIMFALFVVTIVAIGVYAESETIVYTGFIDSNTTLKEYPLPLEAGQFVFILAEATSGDLDTYLYLFDPDGQIVSSNDDRSADSYDSALGYQAPFTGVYTVQVTRYPGYVSSGTYRLQITIGDDSSVLDPLLELTRIQLSGPMLVRDTPHFRIHYTLQGSDRVTEAYVDAVAHVLEEVWEIQINRMGWPPPPPDGFMGGDSRYDVYLMDLLGSGEGTLGYTAIESIIGSNPHTDFTETRAATSYIVIDNDFAEISRGSPLSLMRATVAHEFHHAIQFGFDSDDPHEWFYEATAVWMETATVGKDEDATGYIEYAYMYPELCFGTDNDPGQGQLMYGEWTFIQMLVDLYGDDIVLELWRNIALYDGFEALERTLAAHNATIPQIIAEYRVKNLARDYVLAPRFNATVWLENTINGPGRWSYSGRGIQELGANYFRLNAPPGVYYAGLVNDGGMLELYAVGVVDGLVEATALGRGGAIDTTRYSTTYLMVFDPTYSEDVSNCVYRDYSIDLMATKSAPPPVSFTFPSTYYQTLR